MKPEPLYFSGIGLGFGKSQGHFGHGGMNCLYRDSMALKMPMGHGIINPLVQIYM